MRGWYLMGSFPHRRVLTTLLLAFLPIAWMGLFGCASRRGVKSPPAEVGSRPWSNTAPSDPYPDPDVTLVTNLAAALGPTPSTSQPMPVAGKPLQVLILSGGGKYGAFTAGVLNGWTAAGTRPRFDVVTGISSGALTAVYAFLGPTYDCKLAYYFTQLEKSQLFNARPIRGIILQGAMASEEPLRKIIEEEITAEMVAQMRQAHLEGRRLFIATNNVMAQRLAIWDVGAIAASGRPDSIELIRKIVLAAASIPSWTPPIEFNVTVNGCRYQEWHADAGNVTQGFVRTANGLGAGSDLYVLSAGKLFPDPITKRPGVIKNVSGAISNALYALFRANMLNVYSLSMATHSRFHMIALPKDVQVEPGSLAFDKNDLKVLYDVGYRMAGDPASWRASPPGVMPDEQVNPRTGTEFVAP